MDRKTKLIIWVCIDLILLALSILSISSYFETTATLKSPCGVCASDNPDFEYCAQTTLRQQTINNNQKIELEKKE